MQSIILLMDLGIVLLYKMWKKWHDLQNEKTILRVEWRFRGYL